jgi:Restriction endonuclease
VDQLNFTNWTPTEFEEFCFSLLEDNERFRNVDWRKGTPKPGSPADRGRDIVAQVLQDDPDGHQRLERWHVDCKHYKSAVPVAAIQDLLAWATAEQADVALIITSGYLSNPCKDFLESHNKRFRVPRCRYWELPDLERLTHGSRITIERFRRTRQLHGVRQFFRGLRPGQLVPIVSASTAPGTGDYISLPDSDVHAVQALEHALTLIGCKPQPLADVRALTDFERIVNDDFVLVCAPYRNAFARRVLDPDASVRPQAKARFVGTGSLRAIEVAGGGDVFQANPSASDPSVDPVEYALIARYDNPWSERRHIFMLGGLFALGTHAIGTFLKDLDNYERLPHTDGDIEVVLTIRYRDPDPMRYAYSIDDALTPLE